MQNIKARLLMPAAARRSSQSCKIAQAPASRPTTRSWSLAVQNADHAALGVGLLGVSANASLMRRPARYSTTIKAWLRTPVTARFEQVRISALTSSGVSGSGAACDPCWRE